jgi:hypothetical protein
VEGKICSYHHLSIADQLIEYEQKLTTNEFFSRLIGRAPSKLVDSHDLIKLTPQLPERERERERSEASLKLSMHAKTKSSI